MQPSGKTTEENVKEYMNTLSPWRYYFENGLIAATNRLPKDSFWFRNYFIDMNEHYVGGAEKGKPAIKLIQISDLHLKTISSALKKAVRKINALKPDLICHTGDDIDRDEQLAQLEEFLSLFDKEIPKVAILGNWEIGGNVDLQALKKLYVRFNGTVLMNETRQFTFNRKTVSITGLNDYSYGKADYAQAIKDYAPSDYHVVLTHCPEHRDIISKQLSPSVPVDFILSGHTHGGQLNFFGITPPLPIGSGNYVSGWYNHIEPPMYVSKGLGTSILPVRIGCTAEIGVFYLKG